jgi:hypothetical protein
MAIVVQPADLEADRDLIIVLLSRHLGMHCNGRRFDWLYRDNPAGPARVWIALGTHDKAMGVAAAFPRSMYVEEKEEIGCILGDFCLDEAARSLGPALRLQRACVAEIGSGKRPVGYDLPSRRMLAVYQRMGVEPRGRFVRFAKLLRADEKISSVLGDGMLTRVGSAGANQLLGALHGWRTNLHGFEVSQQAGLCGDDFCALARRVGNRYGTCAVRSAQYLNWRYFAHPYRRYEMITARRNGELRGYGVFHRTDRHAAIADLLAIDEPVAEVLLRQMVEHMQCRGVCTVSCSALVSSRLSQILRRDGFRARETTPVILYESGQSEHGAISVDDNRWFLLDGDRES